MRVMQLFFLQMFFASSTVYAAGLHQCTGPDGSVTFSDTACPGNSIKSEQIDVPRSQPAAPTQNDYWSVENQARRLDARKAEEQQESMKRRVVEEQIELQRQGQRQIEANQEEAKRLYSDAQELYEEAARTRSKNRKALLEQAKSLERQADVLLGRRQTSAPTDAEILQQRIEETEEQTRRAQEQARRAQEAAEAAESAARSAEMEARSRR